MTAYSVLYHNSKKVMASNSKTSTDVPSIAAEAVLAKSDFDSTNATVVKGYDFNNGIDHHALLSSYTTSGFSATNFGLSVQEITRMINKKLEVPVEDITDFNSHTNRRLSNCTIFLGLTSNLVSCGVRETIRYLVEHNMVDCLVVTAGGVEEDFIKCLGNTYMGAFDLPGKDLRRRGVNRIGNMLVPNDNYCKFEDWVMPILDQMLEEQNSQGMKWTPSKVIHRLGKEINDKSSIYYWCYHNNIPVFSPALTDGSLGDMLYFHSYKSSGLVIDIVEDIRKMNNQAVTAKHSGMIILGGGLVKHHVSNANLMRNGADFSVNVNTGQEFDGSDSGARPDEAVSWGKIKMDATPVKLYADASLAFPLIVAETFARYQQQFDQRLEKEKSLPVKTD
ncbi:DHPS [Bugula neritina]|uniref:deoxyhypusine synthase n=1 Tax=Bugula neritina TaxID=10212 RepID=A0A7J7JD93_BUGNE|nr:DHPS [Bugula neritina]